MRDGFIIHEKTLKQALMLEPEDRGYLLGCLTTYYYDGEVDMEAVKSVSVAVAVILMDAMERMDADAEAYEKSIEQRKDAAKKRWQKSADDMREDAGGMRTDATAMREDADGMREDANSMRNDAVSVSVSDSVIKEKPSNEGKKKSSRFSAPTVEQVEAYCQEKSYQVDAERFVDFYASKGWKVGSSPMKDWQAAVRNWAKRDKEEKPPNREAPKNKFNNFEQRTETYDWAALERSLLGRSGGVA